jgi:dihydrofolate synthase/folylpolyglutamate synthase
MLLSRLERMPRESTNRQHQEALDFLFGRINYERASTMPYRPSTLKLTRMSRLLDLLGNPQQFLKIIHVAGTKGKGSTCAMLHSILRAAGYRVGLYTSPHLNQIEERFVIDGRMCPQDRFVELVHEVRPWVEQLDQETAPHGPTYFEITTAIAFRYFAAEKVEYAVIEVGLGGRLDSTNVCLPLLSVITSISFDHMKQLGNTLPKIAREKAGIIKPLVPVVSGVREASAREVIRRVASEQNSRLIELGTDFHAESINCLPLRPSRFRFRSGLRGPFQQLDDLFVGLCGVHQVENAAVALATCGVLTESGTTIAPAAVRAGLRETECRARVEIVRRHPTVIVDAAHNVASIEALLASIRCPLEHATRWLVFAATQGKDIDRMLRLLLAEFDRCVLTGYLNNPRAVDPARLSRTASQIARERNLDVSIVVRDTPAAAWKLVQETAGDQDLICITGSFFIAGELRELLNVTS